MSIQDELYYKRDKLNQLRGFINTVQCDCCSLKASKKMNLEATTVSKQVRSLERDLGIKLFNRSSSNRLSLTEEGKRFYDKAVVALQNVDSIFKEFIEETDEKYQNTIEIAGFDGILEKMIPLIFEFKKIYPNITFSIHNLSKKEALQKLIENNLDIVFYIYRKDEDTIPELEITNLYKHNSYWIMNKNHPLSNKKEEDITLRDIAKYDFVYLPGMIFMNSFRNFVDDYELVNSFKLENGTIEMLKALIKNSTLITTVSDIYLKRQDLDRLVLKSTCKNFAEARHVSFMNKNTKRNAKLFNDFIYNNKEKLFNDLILDCG